jgi:hypothetical protein
MWILQPNSPNQGLSNQPLILLIRMLRMIRIAIKINHEGGSGQLLFSKKMVRKNIFPGHQLFLEA